MQTKLKILHTQLVIFYTSCFHASLSMREGFLRNP